MDLNYYSQIQMTKDEFGELTIDQQAYEALEQNVQKVVAQLSQESSLDRFKSEYEKLFRAMKTSHDNEFKLLNKCRELNKDIIQNASKVNAAIKMTQEDSNTIQFLKSELEKTYKVLEISKEREDKNKLKVENLYQEVKHLNAILDKSCFLNNEQSDTVEKLRTMIGEQQGEKAKKTEQLSNLKQEYNQVYETNRQFIAERNELELDYRHLKQQNEELTEKIKKDEGRKKKITDELTNIRSQFEKSRKETETLQQENIKQQDERDRLISLQEQKENKFQQVIQTQEELSSEFTKLREQYQEDIQQLQLKQVERNQGNSKLVSLRKDLNIQYQKNTQLEKGIEIERLAIKTHYNEIKQVRDKRDIILNALRHIEKDISSQKKGTKEDKHLIEELKFTKEDMLKKQLQIEENSRKHQDLLQVLDRTLSSKEDKIKNMSKQTELLDQQISTLKKEKERYGQQASQANQKYQQSLEEIKLKHNLIQELHKKNAETEGKLKQQQQLYEAVRSGRNLYSKQLTETQDEIAEIKRRYKIINYQIAQLKEEIDAKENALSREHAEHKNKDKQIQENSRNLEKQKADIEQKEEQSKNQTGEIGKLYFVIQESTNQRQKIKDEYETIVAERDILGTQLIRRNDESALLYEKIKIQQNILAKGESEYRERLLDIQLLNNKVRDLQRQAIIIYNKAQLVPKLCEINYNLEKNLVEEKLRVKVMSDELENPMNQDRFRNLEGTDPDSYELSAKIKNLQRRLIAKTEEVIELEVITQQKDKNVQELREIMKRQPGIDEAKIISKCQQSLKEKTRTMKSLAAQLNMDQAQLNEYKYERERIVKEIQELQRKFNEQRRRIQIQNESAQSNT